MIGRRPAAPGRPDSFPPNGSARGPDPRRRLGASAILLALLTTPLSAADPGPPPAHKVTIQGDALTPAAAARAFREQASIDVDVSALDAAKTFRLNVQKVDFWAAVHQLAEATGSRVVTTGGRVALKPGKSPTPVPVHVSGPFRFTERETYARTDPETGKATYEVTLEVCWEPSLLAYRIDSSPADARVTNDRGKDVPVRKGGSRALTTGNLATLSVRPELVRGDKSITIKGSVGVTIADKLLTFSFDANKPQPMPAQEGVAVAVKKHGAEGAHWFAEFEVKNPLGGVTVESHEYELLRHNVARLVPPRGDPIPADLVEAADLRYGFKNQAAQVGAGWKLEYRTPGPMREIVVPFELKDIRLP